MRDLQRSQVGVNDPLTKATEVMKKLDSPKASLAKIEFLVCLTALLLFLLPILSSSRRRHNNGMLKIVLWAANTLSSSLITYTLGLMTEASFQNELLLIWATFLLIFFGCSGSFSAYSLEDNEQWKNYYWQCGIKSFLVLTVVIVHGGMAQISLAGILLFLVVPLKFSERLGSNIIACGDSLLRTTKLIADYMSSEHQLSDTSYPDPIDTSYPDPIKMRGYKYVVRGEETRLIDGFGFTIFKRRKEREAAPQMEGPKYRKSLEITDQIITVENVWACQGWLLRGGDEDNKLKDICLSFSLYKVLSSKFCSYSLPREAHEKLWKLIRHGLLAEETGYERAFRVIELELSFLFDSFYTTYPIIFKPGCWPIKMMEVLLLVIGSLVTIGLCFVWYNSTRPQYRVQLATSGGLSIDVLVTSLILMLFTCLELVQLFFIATSEWAKVSLLCKYVQTNSWHGNKRIEKLIGLMCRTQLLKPWERKLRQYSLLESYNHTPSFNQRTAAFSDVRMDGRKQSRTVELSSEVKRAVFHFFKSNPRVLENGKASLRLNQVDDELSWACKLETQTQVIIVWHIATSICEHEMRISDSNFPVATCLSKYLAYLVVFSPKLLPDHPCDAEYIFYQIVFESRKLLEGCNTKEERIRKLKDISETRDDTSRVINQGARLGQQLLNVQNGPNFIWKVLAEFWAELMVYVAPSDDAKAHAEHLAMGGEFVTHLWALVSHAGIKQEPVVERPTLDGS